MRVSVTLALTIAALCAVGAFAQPFVDSASIAGGGGGFATLEATVGADSFGGTVGTAVDPTDPNAVYYYDGLVVRRYSLAGAATQGNGAPVFTPPLPAPGGFGNAQGGVYGTILFFNPSDPQELWFAESSDRNLHVVTLAAGSRTQVASSRIAYTPNVGFNVYDIATDFSGTTPRVFITEGNFAVTNIYRLVLSATAFAVTPVGSVAGSSGPIDFDLAGNLYYCVPPFSGTPATGSEVRMIRWLKATVDAALAPVPVPLTEALADPAATRTIPFAGTVTVFPSVSYIAVRQENSRPVIYAGNNDPVGKAGAVTGSIMRIDIEQPATADDLFWANLTGDAVTGKIVALNPASPFDANEGQWDEAGNGPNGRLYAVFTAFGAPSTGSVAMIVPASLATEIDSLSVSGTVQVEHAGGPFGATVDLLDAGGFLIAAGNAASVPVTITVSNPPAGGGINGTLNVSAVRGRAVFSNLTSSVAGNYTLTYDAATATTQRTVTINQIFEVDVVSIPPVVTINQPFSVTVQLLDSSGTLISGGSGASANVTVAIQTGPAGATLNQTLPASGGVVTFPSLVLSQSGNYTLSFIAFLGAVSQAQGNVPVTVQNQLSLSGGGGTCSVSAVSGNRSAAWSVMLGGLALVGLAMLSRRARRRV